MRRSTILLAVLLAALSAGCARDLGASPDPASASPDDSRPTRSAPHLPTLPPRDAAVTGEVPADIMASLLADAAERSGVAEDEIAVVTAMEVTWSDGSLDCPEPGMFYTQALVDGYHVILDAGEELDYRVTRDGSFRLCEQGRPAGG